MSVVSIPATFRGEAPDSELRLEYIQCYLIRLVWTIYGGGDAANAFTLLLLEAARRHIGPALVILALAFIAYSFAGPWLPGFVSHGGESFLQLVDQQMFTTQGVFGVPTLVSATFIYLFVVFGGVMAYGGLLRFFTDGALAVAGASRGGAGKVAVISSGLFGTVNGK